MGQTDTIWRRVQNVIRERWLAHQALFVGLGFGLAAWVGVEQGSPLNTTSVVMTLAVLVYIAALGRIPIGSPWRLALDYGFALSFYAASPFIIECLHRPIMNDRLWAWDIGLFGQTPSAGLESMSTVWLTELLSAAYLSYLVYLHLALIHAAFKTPELRRALSVPLFSAMAIGFGGYILIPAETPMTAHPDLFVDPALRGGVVTTINTAIHETAAAKYDVFPSLHVLNTLVLLAFDWRHVRRRFWIMIAPAGLMIVATVYLRFHYGVDLLASAIIFAGLVLCLPEMRANLFPLRHQPTTNDPAHTHVRLA